MTTTTPTTLYQRMTAAEQHDYARRVVQFMADGLPQLAALGKGGGQWTPAMRTLMTDALALLQAWPFAQKFAADALRYGDYSARAYRLPVYFQKIRTEMERITPAIAATVFAGFASGNAAQPEKRKPGRPASAATLAKREAEKQQVQMFAEPTVEPVAVPQPLGQRTLATNGTQEQTEQAAQPPAAASAPTVPSGSAAGMPAPESATPAFIPPSLHENGEYRLSIAQKRAFLSPSLQQAADNIRALRTAAGAAAERAKTMADMKAAPEAIAPVASEAQRTLEQVEAIYADIDTELAALWFRLQNASPEWRQTWAQRHGYAPAKGVTVDLHAVLHPDLLHDLRKHYQKVCERQPDFDASMRRQIEQESPEFIAAQKEAAAKKKEAQDILRYLRRKDKAQKPETARAKFVRLQELLGKKEAAAYKPLLTKIEEDWREAQKQAKEASKAASKREQNETRSDSAEREQARPQVKAAQQETKQAINQTIKLA